MAQAVQRAAKPTAMLNGEEPTAAAQMDGEGEEESENFT
jgi:hypothetical protein